MSDGLACYTSVRIEAGAPRWAERHAERLARDARALGLPLPGPAQVLRAIEELARDAFPDGEGVARIELSRGARGAPRLVGSVRGLGPDPPRWRALTARWPHPGPDPGARGAKQAGRPELALASEAARAAGCDEALLFDAAGRLVEGARSNVVVHDARRGLCTPPLERGAVAGLALGVLRERLPELRTRDLSRRALLAAEGVAVVNAVRGARALAGLDGEPLGRGGDALAERLGAALAAAGGPSR